MSVAPLIDMRHVSYTYPHTGSSQAQPALDDLNLHVGEGEYLAILGHNGSGKSTLARHCNALLLPDTGQVLV
ncbi:MAG: ATP-binding cassette domain-containing protein, partial [Ktedonobacteraceae bacterium]